MLVRAVEEPPKARTFVKPSFRSPRSSFAKIPIGHHRKNTPRPTPRGQCPERVPAGVTNPEIASLRGSVERRAAA